MQLNEKVIMITGASSGIGAATAKRLASAGSKLVLIARREDRLNEIQQEFPEAEILIESLDVTDYTAFETAVQDTIDKFGRIDILFNNAGIMPNSPLAEKRRNDWQRMLDINVMGVLNGISAVLPTMEKQRSGHILTTSSTAGHKVFPGFAVYSGTKFAVRAIMDGLRQEEAMNHIKSTIVTPGTVDTELFNTIPDAEARSAEAALHKNVNRSLSADQVAAEVVHAIDSPDNVSISEINVRPIEQLA